MASEASEKEMSFEERVAAAKAACKPALLSGGNPQIPKGDGAGLYRGDAGVEAGYRTSAG